MAASSNNAEFRYIASTTGTAVTVPGSTSMSANINIAVVDLTAMHATNRFRQYGGGKYQGTFTVEFILDHSEHVGLVNAYKAGTVGQAELDFGTGGTLAGNCIITGIDYGATMDGAATLTASGRFTGTITY